MINNSEEKIHAENIQLSASEELNYISRVAKIGYWQKDVTGKNIYWSDALYRIWEIDKTCVDLKCFSMVERIYPDDIELFLQQKSCLLNSLQAIDLQYRILMPDGAIKWVHMLGQVINDEQGHPHSIRGTIQDITDYKVSVLTHEESNKRYDLAMQATSDAIWDWDVAKCSIHRGAGYKRIFGYEEIEVDQPVQSFTNCLHPDDKNRVLEGIYAAIEGITSNWSDTYRYKKADGHYAYVEDKGFLLRDRQGKAIRIVGAMRDITQQKKEEQRLKLLESVVAKTNEGILITSAEPIEDPGPPIVYINDAFAKMTGYSVAEMIGKNPRMLQGPKTNQREIRRLSEAIRQYQGCEITTINYKKNGEEFWVNISISPVTNETGQVTHFTAIERDVTEQKRVENEKRRFSQYLLNRNKELEHFGFIISHQLRAPVASILGLANILEMDRGNPEIVANCTSYLKSAANSLDVAVMDLNKIIMNAYHVD